MEYTLGYREVIPDQTLPDKWKEITLCTGSSQSTLQDIKVPERAGGYCYKDTGKHFTRNRFICWRITHDVLEFVENSLDVNLANNRVRYKFTDTPILDGISIHETVNSVIILVVTVSSIHKLSFAHPDKIHKQEQLYEATVNLTIQSIFSEASMQSTTDPRTFHVIPTAGSTNSPVAHAAASWLIMPQEEALFAVAYNSGIILLLRLDTISGLVHTSELKQESIVPRFLSGIATAFRGRTADVEPAMSLVMHTYGSDVYLFALCREGQLRMWSCNRAQSITGIDVGVNGNTTGQSIQNHGLKKTTNSTDELYLCAYFKLEIRCEFTILKVAQEAGMFKLLRMCTLLAPNQYLVDFSFTTTRLWTVWRTTDIDTVAVMHAQLPLDNNGQVNCEWHSAVLAQPPDKDYIMSDSSTDPRQAYINYIFHPGQFSLTDITRALSIYRKCNFLADINLSPAILKERVCMAVEAEIQAEVMDYELMDEDYLEIVNRCWSKFYSCVLQYHLNGSRPVGLLLLHNVYGTILLKKASFSLLRPMEPLEHLMLCNETSCTSQFKSMPIFSQDINMCQDLITLMSALVILEEKLSDDLKFAFEKELYQLKSPDIITQNLLSKLIFKKDHPFSDFDFQLELHHRLEKVKDITSAMALLLEALTYNLGQPSDELDTDKRQTERYKTLQNINYLFGSQLGISTVSEVVTQITVLRFSICRNLLILQQIALSQPELFDSQSLHVIKSSLAPRTVVLTQAYYIVVWICESNASITPSPALLETSIQRLSLMKLSDGRSTIWQRQHRSFSLLELFIQYGMKQHMYKLVDNTNLDSSNLIPWHSGMLSYVTLVAQLIWPISGIFFFPEWLLSSCQFLLVQEYVRLLSTWCEWNGASRKFILAISLLEMGEPQKACDYFLRASKGVFVDAYLSDLLLPINVTSESSALVHYYLKVIEMFDQHGASDCIIELAMTALTIADKDDPNLPTFHSIIFAQHLNLQHYIEAYNCLNTNPDSARRVDCLRQLVVTLFNQKKLAELVSFPYVDMYHHLEKIMETRARSVDLMENNYYDFLYSFHVNKGNVRKAASIMYEQAMRLSQEPHSLMNVARQTHCLLACLNALHLVNEKYRWIVRPAIDQDCFKERYVPAKKRTLEGDEILPSNMRKQIEVLELQDIKREYVLAEAKLKLMKLNPDIHTTKTCPSEIVAVMSSVGLYVDALRVCEHYNISKASVLECLASRCIQLSQQDDPAACEWLKLHDVFDLGISSLRTDDVAWKLLQHLTLTHEKDGESEIHKAVARKLFHRGTYLPEWLSSSYTKRNPAELLRLMIQMGRLEEAGQFSLEYIKAIMGTGKECFGYKVPLLATGPSVYLPLNTLEYLLLELEHASKEDAEYSEVYESLQKALESYVKNAERISVNMIQMKQCKS